LFALLLDGPYGGAKNEVEVEVEFNGELEALFIVSIFDFHLYGG